MARFGADLERELETIRPPSFDMGDLHRRRRRRTTARRIEAGIVALGVAVIGTLVVVRTLPSKTVPAVPPRPHAVSSFPVGERPSGIAATDGSLWVGHRTLAEVWRIDPATGGVQARIATGTGGPALVAAGGGRVWAVAPSSSGSTVYEIDPDSDAVVASHPVDAVVDAIAVGDGRVWLASRTAGAVFVFTPDGRQLARVTVHGGPAALTLDRGGAWVAGGTDGRITRIALPGYLASTEARTNTRATGLARCAGRLWVATGDGDLVRVDPGTGRVRATQLGRYLTAVATDGRVVWAVDGAGGDATALNCATRRVLGRVPAGREATGVVATPGSAWVVDSGAGVVIELST